MIRTETKDRVLRIEIARPEKKNALTQEMYAAMADALAAADGGEQREEQGVDRVARCGRHDPAHVLAPRALLRAAGPQRLVEFFPCFEHLRPPRRRARAQPGSL